VETRSGFSEPAQGARQAHTSPIYVEIAGRPAGSVEDAEYFLAWIDRLEELIGTRDRVSSKELRELRGSSGFSEGSTRTSDQPKPSGLWGYAPSSR